MEKMATKTIADNRKARHDYFILESYEAGIELTGTEVPRMGSSTVDAAGALRLWRMPSTSRAYPLALEKKAEYYAAMFREVGIL